MPVHAGVVERVAEAVDRGRRIALRLDLRVLRLDVAALRCGVRTHVVHRSDRPSTTGTSRSDGLKITKCTIFVLCEPACAWIFGRCQQ